MFISIFQQKGNHIEKYKDYEFVQKSALIIKLKAEDPKIEFLPGFKQIENMIMNCFGYIIESAEDLPRVEVELFPFPEYKKYVIRSIRPGESLVDVFVKRALKVFEANKAGPVRYLDVYNKYQIFINTRAENEVTAFLNQPDNELDNFEDQILRYGKIRNEISRMFLSVPLNFYQLECNEFHDNLIERVRNCSKRLVQFCIDHNRESNKA